jgi:hypothetical protein
MDSNDFIAHLGKAYDAPEVQRLLAAVGVTKKLKMPKDDIEARADLPKLGLSLIFKPEGPKSSVLIFQAAMFLSNDNKGYTSYSGALPAQLLWTDKPAEVRVKLGKPTESKAALRLDRWTTPDQILTIEYAKESKRIHCVTVHIPKTA